MMKRTDLRGTLQGEMSETMTSRSRERADRSEARRLETLRMTARRFVEESRWYQDGLEEAGVRQPAAKG